MKKLITLVVAGCMVLGSLGTAAAVDVKVSGQWQFAWGYLSNNGLTKNSKTGSHEDRTRARQRINLQTQFIADENLSAMLGLEIGDLNWGNGGGRLDADATDQIKVKSAYVDWTLPNTQIKTRIGIQGLRMPWVVAGNPVMDADVAGITVSSQLTPELGLTVFWARPFDKTWSDDGQTGGKNLHDEMDMFGFMLPIKTDVVRATPWAMLALVGKDSDWYGDGGVGYIVGANGTGAGRGRAPINRNKMDGEGYAWWAGTTFELPILDPFFVKIDAMMGGLDNGDSDSDQFGYFLSGDIGYKFSWGRLSAIGWYSSGDDDVDDRGTIPVISDDNGFFMTSYGMQGKYSRGWDAALSVNGIGLWGMGLQLADVSFIDKLTHTARFMYMGGTNKGDAINGRLNVRDITSTGVSGFNGGYLMTSDRAYEIDLRSIYQVTKELQVGLDLAYLWLDLGDSWDNKDDTKGSFNATVGLQYMF